MEATAIEKYQRRAKSFARSWGYANEADDFAQEALITKLTGRSARLEHLFIDYLRKHYGRTGIRGLSLRPRIDQELSDFSGNVVGGDSRDSEISWGDLRALTPLQSEVLKLLTTSDMSQAEIAKKLSVSPQRVNSILRKEIPLRTSATAEHVKSRKTKKPPARFPLRDVVKSHVERILELHSGNRTHAAADLGISLRGLRYKINEYGIGK